MHSNLTTSKCPLCGEPIAPSEGVSTSIDGRPRFVHAGCQLDDARHNDRMVCEDVLDHFDFTYDRD